MRLCHVFRTAAVVASTALVASSLFAVALGPTSAAPHHGPLAPREGHPDGQADGLFPPGQRLPGAEVLATTPTGIEIEVKGRIPQQRGPNPSAFNGLQAQLQELETQLTAMAMPDMAPARASLTKRVTATSTAKSTKRRATKAKPARSRSRSKTVRRATTRRATASAGAATISVQSTQAPPATLASSVVSFAYAQIGKAYRRNAAGPSAYDCSGLALAAWRTAGVSLSHSAAGQLRQVSRIPRAALTPGDLVFYYPSISHVGIYVGANLIIDAPHTGATITLRDLDIMPVAAFGRP